MIEDLLKPDSPTCLIIQAWLEPVGNLNRFQPAGFPHVGHVLYDAPQEGNATEKICIIDSPASMANHLEAICLAGPNDTELHPDLTGLPYVVCVTDRAYTQGSNRIIVDPQDRHDKTVVTSLTEGHRLASDYFLDALVDVQWKAEEKTTGRRSKKEEVSPWEGTKFRDRLRREFGITEVKRDDRYFIHPEDWWAIYRTIFKYDPNSLVHGVMFAKEQIKISRFLTAHLEAFGARRVGRSGVKFDRLGKTVSGQPVFAVDEETAHEIRATFIFDIAMLRSYGRADQGLSNIQKRLLLELALWKTKRLLEHPFRYRTQCHLMCSRIEISTEKEKLGDILPSLDLKSRIHDCEFGVEPTTKVYYPAYDLFKTGKDDDEPASDRADEAEDEL